MGLTSIEPEEAAASLLSE